eukprot:2940467-Rhodomonas_salina.1
MPVLEISGLRTADTRAGVYIIMTGAASLSHTRADQRVLVKDSLFVGHSTGGNGHCGVKRPSLYTCDFYMAYCEHLGPSVCVS